MNLAETIGSIEKKAAETIAIEQGDYVGENGLLYCHKCNTPKQVRCEMPWGVVTPMCLCKCKQEERDREEAERKAQERQALIARLRRECFPERAMESWTFGDAEGERVIEVARKYVANFETMLEKGKGLLFFGNVGTGKTHAAACIANALIDEAIPVHMTNFATIRNKVQGMYEGRQEYFDKLNSYPLLILDDLSAESKSEFMQEIVYNVIDGRYRAGLPVIITTNLTSEELKNPAELTNQRTFSRLLEMCIPVEVTGNDKRRARLKEDFTQYRDMLGL